MVEVRAEVVFQPLFECLGGAREPELVGVVGRQLEVPYELWELVTLNPRDIKVILLDFLGG